MKPASMTAILLGAAIGIGWGTSYAQKQVDFGQREYNNSCAVCHGAEGKGDGPLAGMIDTRVPDLTGLAKANNGVFPLSRVYDTIEGATIVKGHGSRDMPIWGARYRIEAADFYRDLDYDSRAVVRSRILGVAEYIHRLQAK